MLLSFLTVSFFHTNSTDIFFSFSLILIRQTLKRIQHLRAVNQALTIQQPIHIVWNLLKHLPEDMALRLQFMLLFKIILLKVAPVSPGPVCIIRLSMDKYTGILTITVVTVSFTHITIRCNRTQCLISVNS